MSVQVMDARTSAAFLCHRWRIIAAVAAVGAIIGSVCAVLVPTQVSSTALLLFSQESGSSAPGQEAVTVTQVHIVNSAPVLEKAGKSVTPALSSAEVGRRIKVVAQSSNLIEVKGFSTDPRQAQALTEAVADAYVATLQDHLSSLNGVPVELSSRERALTKQLTELRAEIGTTTERQRAEAATSINGIRDAQLLSALINDQTALLVRLDKVQEAANQASNGSVEVPDIIQHAVPATGSGRSRRAITWAAVGALIAAAGTAGFLLVRRRRDPHVRTRDDLADAVGSTVIAVVRGRPQRSVAGWLALLETYDAPAEEAWTFRQMLRALGAAGRSHDAARLGKRSTPVRNEFPDSVRVLALSGDQRAIAIGPQLAAFAASLGVSTRLVVAGRDDSVAALRAACVTDRVDALPPGLVLAAGDAQDAMTSNADLTIVLTVVDRREPKIVSFPSIATTALAVSPGAATGEELARLAVAVDDLGDRIDGVVVADQDPSDRTSGRHTLDERTQRTALPIRMTGAGPVSTSATTRSTVR